MIVPYIVKLTVQLLLVTIVCCRHIPRAVKRIITNPCYLCITLGIAIDGLIVTGASTFMAKYLERQFNVAPSKANLLIGAFIW